MGWSWHHPALRRGRSRARSPKRRPPSTTRGERGRRRSPGPRRSSPPNSVLAAKEKIRYLFLSDNFNFTSLHESNVRLRRRRPRRAGRQMSISQQEPLRARASVAFLPSCRARQVDKPLWRSPRSPRGDPPPHLFENNPQESGDPIAGDRSVASTHSGVKRSKRTTLVRALERPPRFPNNLVLRPRARHTREDKTETRLLASGFGSEREIRKTNTTVLW